MITDPIPNLPKCRACGNAVNEQDQFCINCGFPLKGTEQNKTCLFPPVILENTRYKNCTGKLKMHKPLYLYWPDYFLVVGVIAYFIAGQNELAFAALIQNLILAAVFLALGGWAKSKPCCCPYIRARFIYTCTTYFYD
jgi:hypothetical protein